MEVFDKRNESLFSIYSYSMNSTGALGVIIIFHVELSCTVTGRSLRLQASICVL